MKLWFKSVRLGPLYERINWRVIYGRRIEIVVEQRMNIMSYEGAVTSAY